MVSKLGENIADLDEFGNVFTGYTREKLKEQGFMVRVSKAREVLPGLC